jgi:hypothetical protein
LPFFRHERLRVTPECTRKEVAMYQLYLVARHLEPAQGLRSATEITLQARAAARAHERERLVARRDDERERHRRLPLVARARARRARARPLEI